MKSKIYELIGRAVVYITIYAGAVAGFVWACTRIVIY